MTYERYNTENSFKPFQSDKTLCWKLYQSDRIVVFRIVSLFIGDNVSNKDPHF